MYQPKKESKDSKIPIALSVFLEKNPLIKTIHLHLDNDKTGKMCIRDRWNIKVHYSKLTGEWNVEGKSYDRGNLKAYNTYGTKRVNAYKIIEDTLNMKDVRVFDYIEDDEGKKKAVLNLSLIHI